MTDFQIPTVKQCEKAIKIKAAAWAGRCYEIACKINQALKLGLREVHGHYHGNVAKGSMFFQRQIVRHGWLETRDGRVLDFTRWEFEQRKPYVYFSDVQCYCEDFEAADDDGYACHCGHVQEEHDHGFFRPCGIGRREYDEGGDVFRGMMREKMKDLLKTKKFTGRFAERCQLKFKTPAAFERVALLLGVPKEIQFGKNRKLVIDMLIGHVFDLANMTRDQLGSHIAEIYQAIVDAGFGGALPIDNRRKILG